jgi:hypothetical protein
MIPEDESLSEAEQKSQEEEKTGKPRKSRFELLQEFAEEVAKGDGELIHSWEIDGLLYDEFGLPK